ncbi:MAG: hypothetical protein HY535_00550 [Chloroflexi bacterium]|nr:hypothetical protein [Chloroflexota bacterium]
MTVAIPLFTAVVSFLFALTVLDQYLERRKAYQLVWTVGLALYGVASLLQALWVGAVVQQEWVFRLWYLTGAMLVAAYLGMGSIYLHVPRRFAHGAFVVLLLLTLLASFLSFRTELAGDLKVLKDRPMANRLKLTEQGQTKEARFYPPSVGGLTALLNVAGSAALIGGAVFSAIVFLRRRAPSYRVVSNVLIAGGAFISASGGALEFLVRPQYHTVSLLVGVVIIYLGFLRSREVFVLYRVPFIHRLRPAGQRPQP